MSTAVAKRESAELVEGAQSRQLEAIKRILSQRTPASEVRTREGRGGQKLKYTDGAYVIRTLNEALGWDWDFVADSEELLMNGDKPFEVKVRGTLTVRMEGRVVTKTQYGCQPIEMLRNGTAPVSIGDAYKGAATDAMKKCASLLGIALDLYDSDYKAEKYAESKETQPTREPEPIPVSKPRGGYHETLPVREPEPPQSARNPHPKTLGDLVTPKQLWMARNLGRELGLEVEEICAGRYNLPLEQISKRAASELIEFLKSQAEVEPEPVRPVKLEGAQPTGETEWPRATGIDAQIFAKCKALKWTPAMLANEIQKRFGLAVSDEPQKSLDALDAGQLKQLDQALAGEFNNRR